MSSFLVRSATNAALLYSSLLQDSSVMAKLLHSRSTDQSQQKPERGRALHIPFFAPSHILNDDIVSANFATLLFPLLPDDL